MKNLLRFHRADAHATACAQHHLTSSVLFHLEYFEGDLDTLKYRRAGYYCLAGFGLRDRFVDECPGDDTQAGRMLDMVTTARMIGLTYDDYAALADGDSIDNLPLYDSHSSYLAPEEDQDLSDFNVRRRGMDTAAFNLGELVDLLGHFPYQIVQETFTKKETPLVVVDDGQARLHLTAIAVRYYLTPTLAEAETNAQGALTVTDLEAEPVDGCYYRSLSDAFEAWADLYEESQKS